jgi:hypothetical protein
MDPPLAPVTEDAMNENIYSETIAKNLLPENLSFDLTVSRKSRINRLPGVKIDIVG